MTMRIAFIGFGGVGQALAKILAEQQHRPRTENLEPVVVAVADVMKGSVYNPNGLDIDKLVEAAEGGNLDDYPDTPALTRGLDSLTTIEGTNADVIVEVTYTDVKTGQPAIDHCRAAFQQRKHVVTTNKGPVALAYHELSSLARENQVLWGFEGTVMSGTPALRLPEMTLAGNEINEIRGILNGTTNYMLTEMEKGKSYEEALEQAQVRGYAEADPTSEVSGFDAQYKAAILAKVVMNAKQLDVANIPCKGIDTLQQEDLERAKKEGKVWRLLATVRRTDDNQVEAFVHPELLALDDPLAGMKGTTNAITYECDLSGTIMLTGPGAGLVETGYSLFIDLIHMQKQNMLMKS